MKNVSTGCWRIVPVLAACLLAQAAASSAEAQIGTIVDPRRVPDAVVNLDAPALVPAYDVGCFATSVTNLAPTAGFWVPGSSNQIATQIVTTGLVPVFAQGDAGFSCSFSTGRDRIGGLVSCSGALTWGDTATITVCFEPATLTALATPSACNAYYCGWPAYVDASVSYVHGQAERDATNNRELARVDTTGCIN